MKRTFVSAFSAAILACMTAYPVAAQPGAAGVATYGAGWRSDYSYTPGKRKCRSWMSGWWLSQPFRAYSANQTSTPSGGSLGCRPDRTRTNGSLPCTPARLSASSSR